MTENGYDGRRRKNGVEELKLAGDLVPRIIVLRGEIETIKNEGRGRKQILARRRVSELTLHVGSKLLLASTTESTSTLVRM